MHTCDAMASGTVTHKATTVAKKSEKSPAKVPSQ
jgi:hypothetical protein